MKTEELIRQLIGVWHSSASSELDQRLELVRRVLVRCHPRQTLAVCLKRRQAGYRERDLLAHIAKRFSTRSSVLAWVYFNPVALKERSAGFESKRTIVEAIRRGTRRFHWLSSRVLHMYAFRPSVVDALAAKRKASGQVSWGPLYSASVIRTGKGKKPRRLMKPNEPLMAVQRSILRYVLAPTVSRLPEYVTGARKDCSIYKNAANHLYKRHVVCLDLAHFFDSIRFRDVYRALQRQILVSHEPADMPFVFHHVLLPPPGHGVSYEDDADIELPCLEHSGSIEGADELAERQDGLPYEIGDGRYIRIPPPPPPEVADEGDAHAEAAWKAASGLELPVDGVIGAIELGASPADLGNAGPLPIVELQPPALAEEQLTLQPPAAVLLAKLMTYRGRLPQGAPTSPAMANIVFAAFDERIIEAIGPDFAYTRYVDDITISIGEKEARKLFGGARGRSVSRQLRRYVESKVRGVLEGSSFSLNDKKTRVGEVALRPTRGQGESGVRDRNDAPRITGLRIRGRELDLPRDSRRALRAALKNLTTKGLAEASRTWIQFRSGTRRPDTRLKTMDSASLGRALRVICPSLVVRWLLSGQPPPSDSEIHEESAIGAKLARLLQDVWSGERTLQRASDEVQVGSAGGVLEWVISAERNLELFELAEEEFGRIIRFVLYLCGMRAHLRAGLKYGARFGKLDEQIASALRLCRVSQAADDAPSEAETELQDGRKRDEGELPAEAADERTSIPSQGKPSHKSEYESTVLDFLRVLRQFRGGEDLPSEFPVWVRGIKENKGDDTEFFVSLWGLLKTLPKWPRERIGSRGVDAFRFVELEVDRRSYRRSKDCVLQDQWWNAVDSRLRRSVYQFGRLLLEELADLMRMALDDDRCRVAPPPPLPDRIEQSATSLITSYSLVLQSPKMVFLPGGLEELSRPESLASLSHSMSRVPNHEPRTIREQHPSSRDHLAEVGFRIARFTYEVTPDDVESRNPFASLLNAAGTDRLLFETIRVLRNYYSHAPGKPVDPEMCASEYKVISAMGNWLNLGQDRKSARRVASGPELAALEKTKGDRPLNRLELTYVEADEVKLFMLEQLDRAFRHAAGSRSAETKPVRSEV